jgi:hypothetical protein
MGFANRPMSWAAVDMAEKKWAAGNPLSADGP